jgi:hypothetical protein
MVPFLLLSLALGTSAKDAKEAERLVKQSIVEYNVGDFDAALADVTKAYKLRPVPALLFNIGQCHRALHHWEKAEFFYRGYLREKPDASNRAKVEELIGEMQQKQRDEKGPGVVPPVAPLAAGPAVAAAAPPPADAQTVPLVVTETQQPTPSPAPSKAVPAAAVEATSPTPEPGAHHPSGVAIGLGSATIAAAAVAAVGAGFMIDFQSTHNNLVGPAVGYNDGTVYVMKKNRAQTWQVITPIAAGVAAACLVGTVLTW